MQSLKNFWQNKFSETDKLAIIGITEQIVSIGIIALIIYLWKN